jgi:putative nucleotidyltransferase with HDIG domain
MANDKPVSLDDVLARVDNLPTISHVAIRVGELVNDPKMGAREISKVMTQDPSLSAKVLKLVNSSYYAIPGGVTDVERAISFIGFNALYQLVLTVSVFRALKTPGGATFDARGLWLHSLAVGSCSEALARRIGHPDPSTCFTAGLLHDFGKIALAKAEGERFARALDSARRDGVSMHIAEAEVGLPPHERVGSRLAKRWRFPATLQIPIENHHKRHLQSVRRDLSTPLLGMLDIVSLADDVCRFHAIGDSGSPKPDTPDADALDALGMTTLSLDGIYTDLMRVLEKSRTFLALIDEPAAKVDQVG